MNKTLKCLRKIVSLVLIVSMIIIPVSEVKAISGIIIFSGTDLATTNPDVAFTDGQTIN